MKKKAKKTTKKKYSGPTLLDTLPKNQGEWLELVIKFTLRGINNPPVFAIDKTMLAQAERLQSELYIWRERERQNKKT
jgi:hypothetical protein